MNVGRIYLLYFKKRIYIYIFFLMDKLHNAQVIVHTYSLLFPLCF